MAMSNRSGQGDIGGTGKGSSDNLGKTHLLSDIFKESPIDNKILTQLQQSLDLKDDKKIRELSTKLLTSTVDSKRGQTKLTASQWKVLMEMADEEKLLKDTRLTKNSTIETVSKETIYVTSAHSDEYHRDNAQSTRPTEPSAMNREFDQQHSITEKNTKDNKELVKLKKQLDDVLKTHSEEISTLKAELEKLKAEKKAQSLEMDKLVKDRDDRQRIIMNMESQLEHLNGDNTRICAENRKIKEENEQTIERLKADKEHAIQKISKEYSKAVNEIFNENKRKNDALVEQHQQETIRNTDRMREIMKERDDLKTRFSKLAGAKLTDQNADIADLSDPNRAMKLSEKFGTLYDDEWTDAFEDLKKKINAKEAITLLIRMLQDCWEFCQRVRDIQMDSLKNVLLHPSQEMASFESVPKRLVGGLGDKPRVSSKDEGAVQELRRKIGVTKCVVEEVKRAFLQETKTWDQKGYERKQLEECTPYLQSCAEVCWLMAIHCPPLYMKLDVKQGDRLDLNYFSNYTTQSDKIDFLVWPPLFNEENGGLLKKGVAEGVRTIKKK